MRGDRIGLEEGEPAAPIRGVPPFLLGDELQVRRFRPRIESARARRAFVIEGSVRRDPDRRPSLRPVDPLGRDLGEHDKREEERDSERPHIAHRSNPASHTPAITRSPASFSIQASMTSRCFARSTERTWKCAVTVSPT